MKNKITTLKLKRGSLKTQILDVEQIYKRFRSAYADAVETLKQDCTAFSKGNNEGQNLYYMILNTVKERYPYC